MPPPSIQTIREEILYEYAKLISRSAYGTLQRGFIIDRFKKMHSGENVHFGYDINQVVGRTIKCIAFVVLPVSS